MAMIFAAFGIPGFVNIPAYATEGGGIGVRPSGYWRKSALFLLKYIFQCDKVLQVIFFQKLL